ncbi:MAG: hypothetical protein KAH17_08085 [Bacteroidales bacterium]|nr:hypothetical protein [Bacteroidales bacterium]
MTGFCAIQKSILGVLVIMLLTQACSQDIDMYAPSKTVPVVYALLDPDFSTQYVRVGQSFLYKGQDSILSNSQLTALKEDFEVYITSFNENGEVEVVRFSPYYGATRDSGLFPQEELQLLSAQMEIKPNTVYKLYLHLKESGTLVYGELKSFDRKFQVIDPLDVKFRTINLFTDGDFYFRFTPVSTKAVYQAILKFNYHEVFQGIPTRHTMEFTLDILFGEENDVFFVGKRFSGELFLREVGLRLSTIEGVSRIPLGLDFHVTAGGEELYYLIKSSQSQFGFSASSNTNLLNGVGVFSTLSHRYIYDIPLSRYTIDSLANSQYTNQLGFVPFSKLSP